jgi:hypothetical protein
MVSKPLALVSLPFNLQELTRVGFGREREKNPRPTTLRFRRLTCNELNSSAQTTYKRSQSIMPEASGHSIHVGTYLNERTRNHFAISSGSNRTL